MIRVGLLQEVDGRLCGFDISGHSGYAEQGADIVCAAVSSAAYMALNTMTDVLHAELSAAVSNGMMHVLISEKDLTLCRDIMEGLKLHMKGLEEEYPQFINVFYSEV